MIGGVLFDFEPFEHFAFGFCACGGAGTGAVSVDEFLELFSFRCDRGVGALVVFAEALLVLEVFVDFAGKEGQFTHRQIEGRVARSVEKGAIV